MQNVMQKDDTIHIALAVHDPKGTYSQHAGVVMVSVFENTGGSACFHILHDDTLTEDNRRKFFRTAEKYNQRVELIDMTERVALLGQDALGLAGAWLSPGTLFRLLIPDVLKLDRIIYLDCDVLVNLDIKELWSINGGGVLSRRRSRRFVHFTRCASKEAGFSSSELRHAFLYRL